VKALRCVSRREERNVAMPVVRNPGLRRAAAEHICEIGVANDLPLTRDFTDGRWDARRQLAAGEAERDEPLLIECPRRSLQEPNAVPSVLDELVVGREDR